MKYKLLCISLYLLKVLSYIFFIFLFALGAAIISYLIMKLYAGDSFMVFLGMWTAAVWVIAWFVFCAFLSQHPIDIIDSWKYSYDLKTGRIKIIESHTVPSSLSFCPNLQASLNDYFHPSSFRERHNLLELLKTSDSNKEDSKEQDPQ